MSGALPLFLVVCFGTCFNFNRNFIRKKVNQRGHFGVLGVDGRIMTINCKGKVVLLQAWSGTEGSRKLRFPDCMTTAQDGGKVVSLTHWPPLPPGIAPGTHFC